MNQKQWNCFRACISQNRSAIFRVKWNRKWKKKKKRHYVFSRSLFVRPSAPRPDTNTDHSIEIGIFPDLHRDIHIPRPVHRDICSTLNHSKSLLVGVTVGWDRCRYLCFGRGSCIWSGNRQSDKRQSGKRRSAEKNLFFNFANAFSINLFDIEQEKNEIKKIIKIEKRKE